MAPTTRSMIRRRPSLARQRSVRRTLSIARRQRVLRSRPLLQQRIEKQHRRKSIRQASIRQPAARQTKVVVLRVPAARPRLPVAPPWLHRQPWTPDPSSPFPQLPFQVKVKPPSNRLQSLESIVSPPPLRRYACGPSIRPFLQTRQGPSLPEEARVSSPPPTPNRVALTIYNEKYVPVLMENMSNLERQDFSNKLNAGKLPGPFSRSQLGWAALIARAKPPGMPIEFFIEKLLKITRKERRRASDETLCFDSLDYVKELLAQQNEKMREVEGKHEMEKIRRKRAERDLKKALKRVPTADGDDAHMGGMGDDQAVPNHTQDDYPDLDEAHNLAQLAAEENLPAICHQVLRHSRALHTLLSDLTISPTRLSAAIVQTIRTVTELRDSIAYHSYDHFTKSQLRQTFRTAASAFNICLAALSHLCRDISGRKHKGHIIYLLCSVFQLAIKDNEHLCRNVAKEAYEIAPDNLPLAQRRVLSSLELHEVEVPDLVSCRTEFLASVFLSKELAKLPRATCFTELLEGLSAELYTKVGNLISATVFGEQVAVSHLPGHISLIAANAPVDEVKILAVAIERDQILKLLKVVLARLSAAAGERGEEMGAADHLAQLVSTERLLTGTGTSTGNQGRSFKVAKERLQSTLCKAVFGEDDGEFAQAMKGAQWEDEWGEELGGGERETVVNDDGEEFVKGIYEMVGWDILEEI